MDFEDPHYADIEGGHPIDIVEYIAESHEWEFDRIHDDQIAMAVEGQWRTYSITIAWSAIDETLRLICSYDADLPTKRMSEFYELLNLINDMCWAGSFTWWDEQKMVMYRYGLILAGEQAPTPEQIDTMIQAAVASCERFYPAVQLVAWADRAPSDAVQVAMAEAYGRA